MRFYSVFVLYSSFSVASVDGFTNDKVVTKFKAPNDSTPPELAKEWAEKDEALLSYIDEIVPAVLDHNGDAAFDEHLKGVQAILRNWESPEYLINAGLFHSIYGTEAFQGFSLPVSERASVQTLIGEKAEKLAWVFCMLDRWSLDQQILQWNEGEDLKETYELRSRPELGRFAMELTTEEFMDFIELSVADFLEQVEGAATKENPKLLWKVGEAYTHRRLAFQKMVEILVYFGSDRLKNKVPQTYNEVYATEGEASRHLVQMMTPPYSDEAVRAIEALKSAGVHPPLDTFAPLPINECKSIA